MYSEHLLAKLQLSRHAGHSDAGTCFNPRPRAGGDRSASLSGSGIRMFQSTPPRGGRLHLCQRQCTSLCFNPRPRAGGDQDIADIVTACDCFNPRPRAGGDSSRSLQCGE